MNSQLKIFASWTLPILLLFAAGCSYIAPGEPEDLEPVKTIGILPAKAESLSHTGTEAAAELEEGVAAINLLLADYFQNSQDVSLISQTELEGLPARELGNPLYVAREAGTQLHYDAILITSVKRYQAREGSEFAVIKPASVAFSLKLLAVKKGQIIWSADFDQTQQPLFENILPKTRTTGSGFRWLTAEELASAGLTKKLNNSPYLKRN